MANRMSTSGTGSASTRAPGALHCVVRYKRNASDFQCDVTQRSPLYGNSREFPRNGHFRAGNSNWNSADFNAWNSRLGNSRALLLPPSRIPSYRVVKYWMSLSKIRISARRLSFCLLRSFGFWLSAFGLFSEPPRGGTGFSN